MINGTIPAALAIAGLLVFSPGPASADASVSTRLDQRGVKYELDEDGDYKVLYNYAAEGRSQLVFVSGGTQSVAGFSVREVYSPAARIGADGIDGAKALSLLTESRRNKLGAWEIAGDVLYFVIKLPDDMSAAQLEAAMDIAAETADDMEITLSGDRDAL